MCLLDLIVSLPSFLSFSDACMYFCFPIYPSLSWSIKYILSLCLSLNAFPKTPTPPKPVNSSFTGCLDCFAFAEVCVERRYWLRCLFKSPCEETIASRLDLSLDSLDLSPSGYFLFIHWASIHIDPCTIRSGNDVLLLARIWPGSFAAEASSASSPSQFMFEQLF